MGGDKAQIYFKLNITWTSHFYHSSSVPALAQAAAMPLLEETTLPQEHPPTVPVVIIGKRFFLNLLLQLNLYHVMSCAPL